MAQKFIYVEPKWNGRRVVRTVASVLAIGGLSLSLVFVERKNKQGWTRNVEIVTEDSLGPHDIEMLAATVVFLTSGSTWSVPNNCISCQVETIGGGAGGTNGSSGSVGTAGGAGVGGVNGAGGNGGNGGAGGTGGGGGAYSKTTGISVTPLGSITISVGAAGGVAGNGGDTWFNGASLAASSCGAKGGTGVRCWRIVCIRYRQ
jgi:hypothetical protein